MRIGIREQLAAVVLVTALVPLAVLAIATWVNSQKFVSQVTSNSLSLTASLKAAQITSDLLLIQSTSSVLTSRIILQNSIKTFYQQNVAGQNWTLAAQDIAEALESGGLGALVQVIIFSRNGTGDPHGILNVTASEANIILPNQYPNGAPVMLGDNGLGYPAELYPSLTYNTSSVSDPADPNINATTVVAFGDFILNSTSKLILGPLQLNESFALISLTLPIIDNIDLNVVLGYMTVVCAASFLIQVVQSRAGLANTGIVLLVGPDRPTNLFQYADRPATSNYHPTINTIDSAMVRYVFPPTPARGQEDRHSVYNANLAKYGTSNFTENQFPAVADGFSCLDTSINNASTLLTTTNENNATVSVGYARPHSPLVDWLLIVEQSHSEAWSPIYQLRSIVLACVFGAIGLVLIFVVPFAHYSVRPIRRLREATKKSIAPPNASLNGSDCSDHDEAGANGARDEENGLSKRSKKGFVVRLKHLTTTGRRKSQAEREEEKRRRGFRIPAKVQDRKHLIQDELSDLTGMKLVSSIVTYANLWLATFNDMTDELLRQYTSLESKVAARTQELEISKKAAEAANESKTLFIANISHELKTPLNGILGMCAVCMSEDDLPKIKRSLQVVYKSGDLLLHLLNDLLTFSKNQIGQQLTLDEREFHLYDIKTQILTIFMQQVQEGRINFEVKFVAPETTSTTDLPKGKRPPALGPNGIGRLKDMRFVTSIYYSHQNRALRF
jgi:osomolarity two-component system, sensor histidine kinase SLN1